MSNFEGIPNSSNSKEHLQQEGEMLPATQVNYQDKVFEKTASGWVNINDRGGYSIPLNMPFAEDLERLLQAQQGEKIGEVSHRGIVFERYTSGWFNKERPDYVIPLNMPFGQELERLYISPNSNEKLNSSHIVPDGQQ